MRLLLIAALIFSQTPVYAEGLQKSETLCYRSFIYRNRTYPVDSKRKQDGEGLRFVLKSNSQSETMLNDYQSHIKASKWPAYVGSLGIVTLVGGLIYSGEIESEIGKTDTRWTAIGVGSSLIIGSLIYGLASMHSNEKTLKRAVEIYNVSATNKEKIQVRFTPLATGQGGEIQTEVPF